MKLYLPLHSLAKQNNYDLLSWPSAVLLQFHNHVADALHRIENHNKNNKLKEQYVFELHHILLKWSFSMMNFIFGIYVISNKLVTLILFVIFHLTSLLKWVHIHPYKTSDICLHLKTKNIIYVLITNAIVFYLLQKYPDCPLSSIFNIKACYEKTIHLTCVQVNGKDGYAECQDTFNVL